MSLKSNLVLIGMPGAGKSTLGVLLAKALGMSFVDTDILIQQRENRLLQDIIDTDGIDSFIKIEEEVISKLNLENHIIATGGSAVYSKKAIEHLKENSEIIYLHTTYKEMKKRVTNIKTRGIVIKSGHSLKDAYNERLPLYMEYSNIVVECSGKDIEACIKEIIDKLN